MALAPCTAALYRAGLVPFALILALLGGASDVRADDGLITQFCLAAFNAAMGSAGKTPPAGMGTFTCNCCLNEVKAGAAIDAAEASCKQKAASRYTL